jgi:hypothetical protein
VTELLRYTYALTHPYEVDEELAVEDDGRVWYWSVKPARNDAGDRAGTFSFELGDEELEEVRSLAGALEIEPEGAPEQARNAIEVVVAAGPAEHLLSRTEPLAGPFADARALGDRLRDRAESSPLAVVRLSWRSADDTLSASSAATLVFDFEHLGERELELIVDPGDFAVLESTPERLDAWWRGADGGTVGLVDEDGGLLGGTTTPALVEPEMRPGVLFMDAFTPRRAGRAELVAAAAGRISLLSAEDEDPDFPQREFRLRSRPVAVDIAP